MIRLYTGKRTILILFVGLSLFLTSCYSDNICLTSEREYYNPRPVSQYGDSTKIAFVSKEGAYLKALGLSAFPLGFQPKYIYKKNGLYIFDKETKVLTLIKDTLSKSISYNYKLKTKLLFIDSLVYCSSPLKAIDSLELKQPREKCFSINVYSKQMKPLDTATFNALYKSCHEELKVDLSILKTLPLSDFGLIIQDIYPKSDKAYIEEIIYNKSDGRTTRQAIFEQIISKLNKTEIEDMLQKMEEHKNTLESSKQFRYERYIKEIRQMAEELFRKH